MDPFFFLGPAEGALFSFRCVTHFRVRFAIHQEEFLKMFPDKKREPPFKGLPFSSILSNTAYFTSILKGVVIGGIHCDSLQAINVTLPFTVAFFPFNLIFCVKVADFSK